MSQAARRLLKNVVAGFAFRNEALWLLFTRLYSSLFFREHETQPELDRRLGVKTVGGVPGWLLTPTQADMTGYAGCSELSLRSALGFLSPYWQTATFVDIGSGKGRALMICSEFRFASVIGIEISPFLYRIAQDNLQALRLSHVRLILANVLDCPLPDGDKVLFCYHSLMRDDLLTLIMRLEADQNGERVIFIYENPVYGELFDERPGWTRLLAVEPNEPDSHATVVWAWGDHMMDRSPDAGRAIRITKPGWRAQLI